MSKTFEDKVLTQINNLRLVKSHSKAKRNLLELGDSIVPILCKLLPDEADWVVQEALVELLGELKNSEAVATLSELYNADLRYEISSAAAIALAKIGNEASLATLFGESNFCRPIPIEDGGAITYEVSYILGQKALPRLVHYLKHPSKSIVVRVLTCINSIAMGSLVYGKTDISDIQSEIANLLKNEHYEIRLAAIKAISNIRKPEVIDQLSPLLHDSFHNVRDEAQNTIHNLKMWFEMYS